VKRNSKKFFFTSKRDDIEDAPTHS